MASASGYNHHRFARAVLKKSRKWEPSLTVQLQPTFWRFEHSQMSFPYEGPMRPFLLALRAQVIPTSLIPFLYDIRPHLSFVDGCLIVEIQDFRKSPETRNRVVMRPAPEALAGTIGVMLERRVGELAGDETLALELESRIIAATSPPLYLGTSILSTRNAVLSLSLTSPAGPTLSADGTYRNPTHSSVDENSSVERMRKLLRAGERSGPFQPNWSILRLQERMANASRIQERENLARMNGFGGGMEGGFGGMPVGPGPGPGAGVGGGGVGEEEKKKSKKKRALEEDGGKVTKKKKMDGEKVKKKKKVEPA